MRNDDIYKTALDRKQRLDLVESITNEINGLFKDLRKFSKALYVGVTLTDEEMFESFPEIHHWRMKHTGWGSVRIYIPIETVKSFLGFKYKSKIWLSGWDDDLYFNWDFSDVERQKFGDDDYMSNDQLSEMYDDIKTVRFNITQDYIKHYLAQNTKAPS